MHIVNVFDMLHWSDRNSVTHSVGKTQTAYCNQFFMQAALLSMQGFPKLTLLNQIFRK